jgi:hypothetical protein
MGSLQAISFQHLRARLSEAAEIVTKDDSPPELCQQSIARWSESSVRNAVSMTFLVYPGGIADGRIEHYYLPGYSRGCLCSGGILRC